MGRSSEEFIKHKEGELNSLQKTEVPFSWHVYFKELENQYKQHEKQDM